MPIWVKLLGAYVVAVFDHWQAMIYSGAASVIVWIMQRALAQQYNMTELPASFLLFALAGAVLIAMFLAWRDERVKVVEAQAALDRLTVPRLSFRYDTLVVGTDDKHAAVTIVGSVYNDGAPSVVQAYNVVAILAGGQRVQGFQRAVTGELSLDKGAAGSPNRVNVFSGADMLQVKTFAKAIERGTPVQGFLLILFPLEFESSLRDIETDFEISFADYRGVRTVLILPKRKRGPDYTFYPGLAQQ